MAFQEQDTSSKKYGKAAKSKALSLAKEAKGIKTPPVRKDLGKRREIRDKMGRHQFTRVKEHDGWKTYRAGKGGVDEHA